MATQAPAGTIVPDSRWAWVICMGNMLACFSMIGMYRCFGVFYPAVMDEFGVEYTQVSLVSGFCTGTMSIGAIFLVTVKGFGRKRVGLVACFFFSMSLLAASQSSSIVMLILFCGAFAGFTSGLGANVVLLTLPVYFDKHRSKAAGLTSSAMSIGALVCAPVISYLIGEFGWRGALLIVSAFSLHACVGISLYRPIATENSEFGPSRDKTVDAEDPSPDPAYRTFRCKSICDCSLFSRPIYLLCYVASMTFWAGMVGCTFLIIPHGMETLGLSRSEASVLLTAQSAGDIAGQLLGGVIGDIKGIDRAILLGSATALSALMTFGITLCNGYLSLCIAAFLFGLCCAPFGGLYIVLYSEVFSPDKMTNAVSYDGFMAAVLTLPATYSLGVIIDATGDVRVAYYACGGSIFVCSICILGIYFLKRNKRGRQRNL